MNWEDKKDPNPSDLPKEPRLPKRKVALLIGFNGTGYQGMQINPGAKSIEGELFNALCKAGGVSKDNSTDTIKGVHAMGNIVSLKLITSDPDLVEKTNALLPEQIRIWGYIATSKSFHAKSSCDSRVYEYLLPSHVLMPPNPKELKSEPGAEDDRRLTTADGKNVYYISRSTLEEQKIMDSYRVEPRVFDTFQSALSMFSGTHNFHNYTVGRGYKDRSSTRYMIDVKARDPILIEDTEWISVRLHGQSFMLHQIRKMISMAAMITRSNTPLSLIPETFEAARINIPKAPALGLLLENPVYEVYNNKIAKANQFDLLNKTPEEAKCRGTIDFDQFKNVTTEFKEKWIYQQIFKTEKEERVFDDYFSLLDSAPENGYGYLNPQGIIPESCIVTTKYTD
ncbi:pseudouridine synthase [Spinellus fusiger]|nr:pseudouridine synthase [Spinellus fusiger]